MGGSTKSNGDSKAPKWAHAIAGGLAGAVSRLAVGPLDVVKIRMQVQLEPIAQGMNSKYTGIVQALRTIVREEGIQVRASIFSSVTLNVKALCITEPLSLSLIHI